jgi:hypothetical protein
MTHRFVPFVIAVLLATFGLALTGCDRDTSSVDTTTAPAVQPPPPPTADEMVRGAMAELQVLEIFPADMAVEQLVSPAWREQMKRFISEWKTRTLATENGSEGVRDLVYTIEDRAREARDAQRIPLVLLLCDVLETLDPANDRARRYREWAEVYNNRPRLEITGWMHLKDPESTSEAPIEHLYAFLDVFVPETGRKEAVQVREKDEFHGYEVLQIVGVNRRGLRLRYNPTGDKFEIYGPRRR